MGAMKECAKCHSVYYCGRDCQFTDWKSHKKMCKKLANQKPASGAGTCSGVMGFKDVLSTGKAFKLNSDNNVSKNVEYGVSGFANDFSKMDLNTNKSSGNIDNMKSCECKKEKFLADITAKINNGSCKITKDAPSKHIKIPSEAGGETQSKKSKSTGYCNECGKAGKVKKCALCRKVAYCSKDCQTQAWSIHKKYCEGRK